MRVRLVPVLKGDSVKVAVMLVTGKRRFTLQKNFMMQ